MLVLFPLEEISSWFPGRQEQGVSSDLSLGRVSYPRLASFSPSVGDVRKSRPYLGAESSSSFSHQERLDQLRSEILQKLEEGDKDSKDDCSHRTILLSAVASLARVCPDLTFLLSVGS